MLVVKVELWPFGEEKYSKTLGYAEIANVGTDRLSDYAFYNANFLEPGEPPNGRMEHQEMDVAGQVQMVGHRRGDGFWTLLKKVMGEVEF